MKNNAFLIKERTDKTKVQMFAGKIIKDKEKLANQQLSWEEFTIKYTWFKLPVEDDLEIEAYKQARPTWVVRYNIYFTKEKEPIHLYVVSKDVGIFVGVNGIIPEKSAIREWKKIFNSQNTAKGRMLNLGDTFPGNRIIRGFIKNVNDSCIYALGQLSIDRTIPSNVKRELKKIIQKSLPPSEE